VGVRLIATDLDGTLLRPDGTLSDRTRSAIAAAEEAGILFVVVTGRPPRWMDVMADVTGHHGVAVCANGALIYDLHTKEVVRQHHIPAETAVRLVDELRRAMPDVVFACERGLQFAHEPAFVPRVELPKDVPVAEMVELLAEPVVKILVRHTSLKPAEMFEIARTLFDDIDTLATCTWGGEDLLEISGPGVTKAFGLEVVAVEHGIDAADVVAVGDMPNDMPMLAWAGHGVAVANAHPDVLALADEITASNADDGVAQLVERILTGQ
jgi:Cof subfamily protein (haloacid dehalogenase superfamily)